MRENRTGSELGQFVALPLSVLSSPAYRGLSVYARALLVDVAMQYGGKNNGQILASRNHMEPLGWRSADTLAKALKELQEAKLLFRTVQGQRPNKASWYALTWRTLDKHDGYDAGTVSTFRRGMYQTITPKPERDALYAKWRKPSVKTQSLVRHTEQEAV
jgi:hypothetical protein